MEYFNKLAGKGKQANGRTEAPIMKHLNATAFAEFNRR
jgi:hypothetical protein